MAKDTSKTLRAALTATAPVFFGYIFVGMAFGLLLQKAGYNALWAFGCSLTVYAGSMQFVLVELLTSWVGLAQTAVVTLAVQARHAFYGLSLIDKFRASGKRSPTSSSRSPTRPTRCSARSRRPRAATGGSSTC